MLQFQPQEHLLHSYIVASQSEQARDRLSLDLAAAMLCRSDGVRPCRTCRDCRKVYDGVHPDVIYVAPDPDAKVPTIKVDQIRGVAATAYILPSEAEKKVYVLRQADTMNLNAQNAFLKLLEEPPDYWLFILVADDREKLLPTIRSRVMELRFDPLSMEDTERVLETIRLQENDRPESLKDAELSQAEARWREQLPILARLAGGSAGKALKWFRLDALELREEILDLVEQAGREDILVYADGLPWMLKNDRQESLVLMELLLLLFRDGLILETGLSQPLYNEDLRQRLALCFAGWTEGMLRKGLELEEKCRRAIASFVTRRMAVEALALEIHQML